jgi:hypothetical protein
MLAKIVATVLRCRKASTDGLVRSLERVPTARRGRSDRPAPVGTVRAVHRLLAGFHNPLRENAAVATTLRALGYPAQLVVGYEPVPVTADRRLFTWLEVDGRVVGTSMPAHTFYPELWRFPAT